MAKGVSLHIGLNKVDPSIYGSEQALKAAVNDALSMSEIARSQNYTSHLLINEQATSDALTAFMLQQTSDLSRGDVVLLTYAGHGTNATFDLEGDEEDGLDEAWCLYDGLFLDDQVYSLLKKFKAGVRVKIITDSCQNATIYRAFMAQFSDEKVAERKIWNPWEDEDIDIDFRFLSDEIAMEVVQNSKEKYAAAKADSQRDRNKLTHASIEVLAACQDYQLAADGVVNGYFTTHLLKTWNEGGYTGNNFDFFPAIKSSMRRGNQTPNRAFLGPQHRKFMSGKPFEI